MSCSYELETEHATEFWSVGSYLVAYDRRYAAQLQPWFHVRLIRNLYTNLRQALNEK